MSESRFTKVLALTGQGMITPQISTDCTTGMQKSGVEATTVGLMYDDDAGFPQVRDKLMNFIREKKPDFIFAVDAGIVRDEPEFFESTGVPVVAWFVDNPLVDMGPHNIFDRLFVFSWDRLYIEPMLDLGCRFARYLPLATNPSSFRRLPPDRPECEPFRCDISFVGSSLADISIQPELEKVADPLVKKVLIEVIEAHSRMPHPPVGGLRTEAEKRHGVRITYHDMRVLDYNLQVEGTFKYRVRAVNRLARRGIHVYGDDGWKQIIGDGVKFRGRIDYEKDLNKMYSASRINLNLSKTQLQTAVNQRVFDAPACGGFVLTDYREDAERLFDVEKEIAVFRSMDEMDELVERFLKDDSDREARARNARRNVLAHHTYAIRMREMLAALEEVI